MELFTLFSFFKLHFVLFVAQNRTLPWTFVRLTCGCVNRKQNQDTSVKTTSETRESTAKHLSFG